MYEKNKEVSLILNKFEKPHTNIHKLVYSVEEFLLENNFESAINLLDSSNDLNELNDNFMELSNYFNNLSARETGLLINDNIIGKSKAIFAVDSVDNIENLIIEDISKYKSNINTYLFLNCGRDNSGKIFPILDISKVNLN